MPCAQTNTTFGQQLHRSFFGIFSRPSHSYTSSANSFIRLRVEFKRYDVTRRLFLSSQRTKTIFNLVRIHASLTANVQRLTLVTKMPIKSKKCAKKNATRFSVFFSQPFNKETHFLGPVCLLRRLRQEPTKITDQQKTIRRWKTERTSSLLELCVFFTELRFDSVRLDRDKKCKKIMINIFIVFRLPLSVSLLFLIPFAFVRVCLSDSAPSTTSQFGGKHFFFLSVGFVSVPFDVVASNRQQPEFYSLFTSVWLWPIVFGVTMRTLSAFWSMCKRCMHVRIVSACCFQ